MDDTEHIYERARREGKKVLVVHPADPIPNSLALIAGHFILHENRFVERGKAYVIDPGFVRREFVGFDWQTRSDESRLLTRADIEATMKKVEERRTAWGRTWEDVLRWVTTESGNVSDERT